MEERPFHVFTLGFAMKKFKKKIQIQRNLEVRLTQDNKVANIQDRVRTNVVESQTVMMKDLMEKERAGGRKPRVTCSVKTITSPESG